MTGLQLLQKMKEGAIPAPGIASTVPMTILSVEHGKIIFESVADKRHLNPLGITHGGFAATVLDAATGCAIHSTLGDNIGYATTDFNIKFLKKIPLDFPLIAEGKIIRVSNRIGVSEATLKDSDGNIYAHATSTCMIFNP